MQPIEPEVPEVPFKVGTMSYVPYIGGGIDAQPKAEQWMAESMSPLRLVSTMSPTTLEAKVPPKYDSYGSRSIPTFPIKSTSPISSFPSPFPPTPTTPTPVPYTDIRCCDEARSVEGMLGRYKKDREMVVTQIKSDISRLASILWKEGSPLSVDNRCMCNLGKGDPSSTFKCPPCRIIGTMTEYKKFSRAGKGVSGIPIKVKCSDVDDSIPGGMARYSLTVIIMESPIQRNPLLLTDPEYQKKAMSVIEKNKAATSCGITLPSEYYSSDKFTNNVLISWLIEDYMRRAGLPHFCPLLSAFMCSRAGYTMYDFSEPLSSLREGLNAMFPSGPLSSSVPIKEIKTIKENIDVRGTPDTKLGPKSLELVKQLVCIWSLLSEIGFTYGRNGTETIAMKSKECSYKWKELSISSPVTLILHGFEYSSMNISNGYKSIRLFSRSDITSDNSYDRVGFPSVTSTRISMSQCPTGFKSSIIPGVCGGTTSDIMIYRITNENFGTLRHTGIPLFPGSYDFYCSMISLLRIRSFSEALMSTPIGVSIWNLMFFPTEREKVRSRIEADLEKVSPGDVLRGISLRCDIVSNVYNLLIASG